MKRRDFFKNTALTGIGASLISPTELFADVRNYSNAEWKGKTAKNIIFLVSDGMSSGTLNMTHLLMQRKLGKSSKWIELYNENKITRALMDTASASSLVTDSAAASSSWGGGVRVNNGSLNIGPNGEKYKPILQKFKEAGKAVGCVSSVPITHATPAGFCINNNKRSSQPEIALQYIPLKFDVMMGGGTEYFDKNLRDDKKDVFAEYVSQGYAVAKTRKEMLNLPGDKPVLGVFYEKSLPYAIDRDNDASLKELTPSLPEMTKVAIERLSKNSKGFVMQVEGGKVDWAAHANDTAALLYDQIAFDEAVAVAIDFADRDKNTLVIITTDHGNANPALLYGDDADKNFDKIQKMKFSNDWVLQGIKADDSVAKVIERIEFAQGIAVAKEEAESILKQYAGLTDVGNYNPYKLPFSSLAAIQKKYTSVGWAGDNHTGDFVELAMYGVGSDQLVPFVKNTDLHYFMLAATGVANK
jgi:alkaline phosphatase